MIKVAFFGTSDRSLPILDSLKKDPEIELVLCITKSDSKVGRKQLVKETEVKAWSKQNNIPCITTDSVKKDSEGIIEQLLGSDVALCIVADFSFIVPETIIDAVKGNIINIHFSILPRYRGASPVQFAIMNGDEISGITYHMLVKEMDRGHIIEQIEYKLSGDERSGELYDKLFVIAAEKLPEVVKRYVSGDAQLTPQDETQAAYTYSKTEPKSTFIYKEDARIDWTESAESIERKIRAFNPWPIAWTTLGDMKNFAGYPVKESKDLSLKVKIYEATIKAGNNNGTNKGNNTANNSANNTTKGLTKELIIEQIQVEGGKILSRKDFENGYLEN